MASLEQPLFFVRRTVNEFGSSRHIYAAGTGLAAVPRLYQLGPAKSAVKRFNKELERKQLAEGDTKWQVIPVSFATDPALKF